MKKLRYDIAKLDAPKLDHNGYLEADAAVTRVGVFVYRHPDGTVTRELRHPDNVFAEDSLATLRNRPVTLGHPMQGRLNARNTKYLAVGSAIGDVKHDQRLVNTRVQVTDEDAIEAVMNTESPIRQVSCGYEAEVVAEVGEYNGEKYDHVQKNIVYNHIALVKRGRAGEEVRLNLDAATMDDDDPEEEVDDDDITAEEDDDAIRVRIGSDTYSTDNTATREVTGVEGVNMVYSSERQESSIREFIFSKSAGWTLDKAKVWAENHRNDSVDADDTLPRNTDMTSKVKIRRPAIATKTFKADAFDVTIDGTPESSEKAFDALNARLDAAIDAILALEGKNDSLQGRIDAMGSQDVVTNKKVFELAKQRADIEGVASYVGLKNFGNLENEALKKAIVIKCSKSDSLDPARMTEEYIQGRYDGIIENIKKEKRGAFSLATLRDVTIEDPSLLGLTAHADDESPRERLHRETANMWQVPAASDKAN